MKKTNQQKLDDLKKIKDYFIVTVDGNTHHLPVQIRTKKETITRAKMQQIVAAVFVKFEIKINRLEIWDWEFDYSGFTASDVPYIESGDVSVPQSRNKKYYYDVAKDCLQIWDDGYPVYEDNGGVVTDDLNALCDCLM